MKKTHNTHNTQDQMNEMDTCFQIRICCFFTSISCLFCIASTEMCPDDIILISYYDCNQYYCFDSTCMENVSTLFYSDCCMPERVDCCCVFSHEQ